MTYFMMHDPNDLQGCYFNNLIDLLHNMLIHYERDLFQAIV